MIERQRCSPPTPRSPERTEEEKAAGLKSGGVKERCLFGSGFDRIRALAVRSLGGLDRQAMLLCQGAASAHKRSRGVRLPAHFGEVRPQEFLGIPFRSFKMSLKPEQNLIVVEVPTLSMKLFEFGVKLGIGGHSPVGMA
jgi:hypothetical protein